MPPITGPESIKKRGAIIAAMERDEWAFREQVKNNKNRQTSMHNAYMLIGNTRHSGLANGTVRANVERVARKNKKQDRGENENVLRNEAEREGTKTGKVKT